VAFLMDQRHLWMRSARQNVILRVRHSVERAIRDFFDGRGFTLVDAPVFTPSACEGTKHALRGAYFDLGKAYLTQSGQLYMEAAAMALGKVYCFGPTFRAEKSKTRRHLTEFWMVEPEVAFMDLDGGHAAHGGVRLPRRADGPREAPPTRSPAFWSATCRGSTRCGRPSPASPTPRPSR